MRHTATDEGRRRLELWLREGADGTVLRRRLEALEREGVVDEATVHTWPRFRDVPRRGRMGEPTLALRRLAGLREWARVHDERLPGPGETTRVGTGRMGPETTARRLPRALLAEFRGDRLVRVSPCESGSPCVLRRLDELAGEARADPPAPTRAGAPLPVPVP
jgi:hypothetical protein